jgi:hypothetical protein
VYPPTITGATFLGADLWRQCDTAFGYLQSKGMHSADLLDLLARVGISLGSVFLKPVHPVSLGHGWVCSPGGSLVSWAKCSLLPPPPQCIFTAKRADPRCYPPPPPELPGNGVCSPLTPPQGNTGYRFQKNATLGVCMQLTRHLQQQVTRFTGCKCCLCMVGCDLWHTASPLPRPAWLLSLLWQL